MSNFTPGPWETVKMITLRNEWNGEICIREKLPDDSPNAPAWIATAVKQIEVEANALLIAAAPDLLAVAQAVIDFYGGPGAETDSPLHQMAIAAIRKATGE